MLDYILVLEELNYRSINYFYFYLFVYMNSFFSTNINKEK